MELIEQTDRGIIVSAGQRNLDGASPPLHLQTDPAIVRNIAIGTSLGVMKQFVLLLRKDIKRLLGLPGATRSMPILGALRFEATTLVLCPSRWNLIMMEPHLAARHGRCDLRGADHGCDECRCGFLDGGKAPALTKVVFAIDAGQFDMLQTT